MSDSLIRRSQEELRAFTDWCRAHGVQGYIGEAGWPKPFRPNHHGNWITFPDAAEWNALGDAWLDLCRAEGLAVTAWSAGELWGPDYEILLYDQDGSGNWYDTGIAAVWEKHVGDHPIRGVAVAGAEFEAPRDNAATHRFSNANPGREGADFVWHRTSSLFAFLASRGHKFVRLPFRWERLQPTPGGGFDPTYLSGLRETIDNAWRSGLQIILDCHNYAAYYVHNSADGKGYRRVIGASDGVITQDHFNDLWRRLIAEFEPHPAVFAWDTMNEPNSVEGGSEREQAQRWETITQGVVDAIRGAGSTKQIMISGYNYSSTQEWTQRHPTAWIRDPLNNFRYHAHQYFDEPHSGSYRRSYGFEVTTARRDGFGPGLEVLAPAQPAPWATTLGPRGTEGILIDGREGAKKFRIEGGEARIVEDFLRLRNGHNKGEVRLLLPSGGVPPMANFEAEIVMRQVAGGSMKFQFRRADPSNWWYCELKHDAHKMQVYYTVNLNQWVYQGYEVPVQTQRWQRFNVRAIGPRVEVWFNGVKHVDTLNSTHRGAGGFAIEVAGPWWSDVVGDLKFLRITPR